MGIKKLSFIVPVVACLSLSSCIDIFQYVSIQRGELHTVVRTTAQKSLFAMAASFSDSEPDYSGFDLTSGEILGKFSGTGLATVTEIQNELEIGFELTVRGNLNVIKTTLGDMSEFIPQQQGNRFFLKLPAFGNSNELETSGYGAVFLSAAKYRILLSLTDDLQHIRKAYLLDTANPDIAHDLYPRMYGRTLLIEVPMMFLFSANGELFIVLEA